MRIAIVSTCLLACSASVTHGSFIEGRAELQAALGEAAAEKLAEDYGGDQRIAFTHEARDPFGRALEAALRAHGFRVLAAPDGEALALSYVADAVKGSRLIRVAMSVDGRVLARAYASRGGAVRAVGPWTSGGGR